MKVRFGILFVVLVLGFWACQPRAFSLAEDYVRKGKFYLAIEEYISFSTENPSHRKATEALFEAGRLQRMVLNNPDEAVKTYQTLVTRFPVTEYTLKAQLQLAEIQKNHHQNFHQAIIEYEKFIRTAPRHPEAPHALFEISQCYMQLHKHEQAQIELETLMKEYPDYIKMDEVYFTMGNNSYIGGLYPQALKAYDKIIKDYSSSPYYAQAIFGIGSTYEELDDYKKAKEYYEEALPLYPSKKVILIRLHAIKDRQSKKLNS